MDAEHKPVTIAEGIAGGQTIATHCLACGHRGELDPLALAVVEGDTTTMGAAGSAATVAALPAGRAADAG
jgi:hypothetical protein